MEALTLVALFIVGFCWGSASARAYGKTKESETIDELQKRLMGSQIMIGDLKQTIIVEQTNRILMEKEMQVEGRVRQAILARDHE